MVLAGASSKFTFLEGLSYKKHEPKFVLEPEWKIIFQISFVVQTPSNRVQSNFEVVYLRNYWEKKMRSGKKRQLISISTFQESNCSLTNKFTTKVCITENFHTWVNVFRWKNIKFLMTSTNAFFGNVSLIWQSSIKFLKGFSVACMVKLLLKKNIHYCKR